MVLKTHIKNREKCDVLTSKFVVACQISTLVILDAPGSRPMWHDVWGSEGTPLLFEDPTISETCQMEEGVSHPSLS